VQERNERERLHGLPQIVDLTGEPVAGGAADEALAEVLFVSREQLNEALRKVREVDELPARRGVAIVFVPYGSGFLGIPTCESDEHTTCIAVRDGDQFVCLCRPTLGGAHHQPLQGICELEFSMSPFRLICRGHRCRGECRLVAQILSRGHGPASRIIQISCECVE
jgi:hypothetical protein